MFYRGAVVAFLMTLAIAATGCSSIVGALLVYELLDDKAPRRDWTGYVKDKDGNAVEGIEVIVKGEVTGDTDVATFSDFTDDEGYYDISYRWNKEIKYTITVEQEGVEIAERYEGRIELENQRTDFTIESFVKGDLVGRIIDFNGDPVNGVLVIGGTVEAVNDPVEIMLNSNEDPTFDLTNINGEYHLGGNLDRYGIVCAFHPTYGWAYAYDDSKQNDGSIELNITLGDTGDYTVQVQVVDNLGQPIADQVLSADRRFRLVLDQPFDMSEAIDLVVQDEDLFGSLSGPPSASHPEREELSIVSTGPNGIANIFEIVPGGTYEITLLEIDTSSPATALVDGDNPLVLFEDATVVIRVN